MLSIFLGVQTFGGDAVLVFIGENTAVIDSFIYQVHTATFALALTLF